MRRSFYDDERAAQYNFIIPETLMKKVRVVVAQNNPEVYYNISHFVTIALVRLLKEHGAL